VKSFVDIMKQKANPNRIGFTLVTSSEETSNFLWKI